MRSLEAISLKKDIKNIFKYKVEELKTPEDEKKTETEKSADRIQFFLSTSYIYRLNRVPFIQGYS
ncbi:hypothetical protein CRU79_04860 [Escherichia sp. E4385]|nr:hypothetical protein CRU79_04860 [Escherichia sp. E4385]